MSGAEPIAATQTSLERALCIEVIPLVHKTGLIVGAVKAAAVSKEANISQIVGDGIVNIRLRVVKKKVVGQVGFILASHRWSTDRDEVALRCIDAIAAAIVIES